MNMEFNAFYPRQSEPDREKYKSLIKGATQLSPLHSDSPKPYVDYRIVERIFCKSFSADDKSRQDVSVDAVKLEDGIGIKTFVTGGGFSKYEKIAEFVNRTKYPLDEGNPQKMISQVAEYRNDRIEETVKEFDLKNTVYHYLARGPKKILICECPMIPIDTGSISLETSRPKGNLVKFSDKYFSYQFHLSKHTLFKKFDYEAPFYTVEVDFAIDKELLAWTVEELSNRGEAEKPFLKKYDYVVLPLYSTRTGEVPEKSGLNQWNAKGRPRNYDEVYIPIPAAVHKNNPGFFPERDKKFKLKTQDKKELSAKVCQDNSKALMTDPNKDLGKWLLRDTLELKQGEVATRDYLAKRGADTVIIYKLADEEYRISLHSLGGFEKEYGAGAKK